MSKKYRLLAILLSVLLVFSGWGGLLPEELVAADDQPDLFFSEYIEGTSNNKALEIYNPTDASISLAGYKIEMYFNGNLNAGLTINLTGTIASGGVYVVAHEKANATILGKANQTDNSGWYNGDDAIVLRRGDTVLDRIGQVGANDKWGVDKTLVRKSTIKQGDKKLLDDFDPSIEWRSIGKDNFSNLGEHEIKYEVTFQLDGKGVFDEIALSRQEVKKGESATSPSVIPCDGYSIVGWDKEFKEVTSDIVVTAIFQEWTQPGVFFSEYAFKAGNNGNDKALEIFNGTDEEVVLDEEKYKILMYSNGQTSSPHTISLDGLIRPGETFVIARGGGLFESYADLLVIGGAGWFNGNDAIALTKDGQIVDLIGKIGHDPGNNIGWQGGGVSTYDSILVRKPQVGQGVTIYGDSNYQNDAFCFDPSLQWTAVTSHSLKTHDCQVIHSVQFLQGEHGTLTEKDYYHVYKGRGLTDRPQVHPEIGYKYKDWSISPANADFNSITSDLVATATYEKETYPVTFNLLDKAERSGGGSLEQYIAYGEGVTDSPLVTPMIGYTIIGWDKDFRKVTSPLDVTAQYQDWDYDYLDLFFSKYIEGSGYNKALEIFNPTAREISLSSEGYKVAIYHNYNAKENPPQYGLEKEIALQGTIGPHQTFVIKHGIAETNFSGAQIDNGLEFNGNDRVVLMKGSTIIDEIGKKNENPDSRINPTGDSVKGWEMGGISTANMTLWRKDWVDRGAIHDDLGLFDPSVQWVSKGKDSFDGLGTHTCSVVHLVQFFPGEHGQLSGELTQAVYHGDPATVPDVSPETGYSFHTWGSNVDSITDDLEVTAQWIPNSYTVSFQSDGVGDTNARNVVYDAPYGDLPLHTKAGHNFLGWFDAKTGGNEITSDTILKTASNHTLYAQWGINSYTLSFDSKEGSDVPSITQEYGTPIGGPDDPVRTGYTFLGWDPALPDTMPAYDMTLEAQWALNTYIITFDTGRGSKIAPMTVDYGATIVPPASPVWSCCSFKGWNPALPATMPAEDLTVKALWEVNAYTIIFDSAGGSIIPPLSQDFGSPISPPQDPVRTGYTFLGWEPGLPDTMPMAGMEVVAQWQINQYRLIFDSNGGSPLAPQVLDYGSEIKAPVNPLRLGYRFMGWEPALPDRMGASDMTVKALWQRVGVVEGEDDETPGQGAPGAGDKPGSGQGSDLDRVPSTGESLPMTESLAFLGLAFLLLLAWRRRLFDLKKGKKEQA